MLAPHTSRTVAERLDTQALRQPSPWRRLRWQLGAAAFALALVIPVTALMRGDHSVFQSGTLSMSHQFIAHDCARCHDTPGQTGWRAVSFSGAASTVSEQACLACHAAPAHHAAVPTTRRCAECHREHRGPGPLSQVAASFCTECHVSLPPSASFFQHIPSFAAHPEFAALRPADDASIGARHELLRRAVKNPHTNRWQDKAAIALNHKVHLNPKGLPMHSDASQQGVGLEQLNCQSCHQPEAATGNFRPIRFEDHCARCHQDQLTFTGKEPGATKDLSPLPHRLPEIVRGVLRERLSQALLNAAPADDSEREKPLRRFFPGVPDPKPLDESQGEAIARQLQLAEGLLFSPKPEGALRGAGCAYCHEVTRVGDRVQITPPGIPQPWLSHSSFRHDAHRQLACVACHANAPQSTATADILLPSIGQCRKCHLAEQDASSSHVGSPGAARADCAECHKYHLHKGAAWDGKHDLP